MSNMALEWALHHEFAHLHAGHLDLVAKMTGHAGLLELGMTRGTQLEPHISKSNGSGCRRLGGKVLGHSLQGLTRTTCCRRAKNSNLLKTT